MSGKFWFFDFLVDNHFWCQFSREMDVQKSVPKICTPKFQHSKMSCLFTCILSPTVTDPLLDSIRQEEFANHNRFPIWDPQASLKCSQASHSLPLFLKVCHSNYSRIYIGQNQLNCPETQQTTPMPTPRPAETQCEWSAGPTTLSPTNRFDIIISAFWTRITDPNWTGKQAPRLDVPSKLMCH